jgi:predicted pyridoxine 5'-phosphate oxidase superfamily flavin-nucleotide-binding protein
MNPAPFLHASQDRIMTHRFADIAFTDSVKAVQSAYGSREHNDRLQEIAGPNDRIGAREAAYIAERDTFYLASVGDSGWPYVQHRGGPKGFLKVLDEGRLGYADFRGNTQLVSVGNVSVDDRVSLILMDYPRRKRLKILGHMQVHNAQEVAPELLQQVQLDEYRAEVERVVVIEVAAFDWNCPQHITRRYTEEEFLALDHV